MMQVIFAALLAAIMGAVFLFFGYRFFLVMLPIWGFFAGFWLGAEGVTLIFGGGFLVTVTGWVLGFVLGLIGALLSYLFYTFGVIIVAAGFGAAIGSGLMAALGFDGGFFVAIVSLVTAVMMAGLTVLFNLQKFVIIAITSIGGANALLLSVLLLFGQVSLVSLKNAGNAIAPILQNSWLWLIVWLALAVAGMAFQLRVNREYTFNRKDYSSDWG